MTLINKEASAILYAINHPNEYCDICYKEKKICKHTKRLKQPKVK